MTPRQILGVGPTATEDECKAAFRKLARQYHPDVNKAPGAEEKFKAITEAWEIIQRPESASNRRAAARAAYSRTEYTRVYNFTPPPKRVATQVSSWKVRGDSRRLQRIIDELSIWSAQRGWALKIDVINNTYINVQLTADPITCDLVHQWMAAIIGISPPTTTRTPPRTAPPRRPPVQDMTVKEFGRLMLAVSTLILMVMAFVVPLLVLVFHG
jgi:hypothetical protein